MVVRKRLKGVFSIRRHFIMELPLASVEGSLPSGLKFSLAESSADVIDGTYGRAIQLALMRKNGSLCEQYIMRNEQAAIVGTLSLMYRGGNELEYRIRNIDAFVYNLAVLPEWRGRGYAGAMITSLASVLRPKGIDSIYLAVSEDNAAAIHAYNKVGFETVCKKMFVRTFKLNIPYYAL